MGWFRSCYIGRFIRCGSATANLNRAELWSTFNQDNGALSLFSLGLPQAHPRATVILVDELNASPLKSVPYRQVVGCCQRGVTLGELSTPDRAKTDN
jgi:hypothetical protein